MCNIALVIATTKSGGLSHPVRFRGTAMPTQHTKTLSPPNKPYPHARIRQDCGRLAHCPRCVENWQFSESDTIALNAMRYKIKRTRPLSYSLANVVKKIESAMMLYNTFKISIHHYLFVCHLHPYGDCS